MAKIECWWHLAVIRLTEAGAVDERRVDASSVSRQKVRDWMLRDACVTSQRSGYRQENAGADRVNLLGGDSRVRLVYAVVRCRRDDDDCEGGCCVR